MSFQVSNPPTKSGYAHMFTGMCISAPVPRFAARAKLPSLSQGWPEVGQRNSGQPPLSQRQGLKLSKHFREPR